jgi:Mor family transcriptional regulator
MSLINEMEVLLAETMGDRTLAQRLTRIIVQRFAGEQLYIPHTDYHQRNLTMIKRHAAGASVERLASDYRLSTRTVRRIIANHTHRPQNYED